MKVEIGAYEAKTKLPQLLRGVKAGNRYTITHRGEAVAELVPVATRDARAAGDAVEQLKRLMETDPVKGADIRGLIDEGRR